MRFHRPERVSDLIIEELNKILLKELELPGVLVTITDAEVSKDLSQAKVKITIYPSEKSDEAFRILEKSRNRLQFLLTRKLNIKPMPQISFKLDLGPERAAKIEKALEKFRH